MTTLNDPPEPGRKRQAVAGYTALIATLFIDPQAIDWKQWLLILIAAVGFVYVGYIFWVQYKARKEWRKSQPAVVAAVDEPVYPGLKHNAVFMVAITSFFSLCAFCAPRREIGLVGSEWWILLLLPISIAAFWYARRIQDQYNKVYWAWRDAQGRSSN